MQQLRGARASRPLKYAQLAESFVNIGAVGHSSVTESNAELARNGQDNTFGKVQRRRLFASTIVVDAAGRVCPASQAETAWMSLLTALVAGWVSLRCFLVRPDPLESSHWMPGCLVCISG